MDAMVESGGGPEAEEWVFYLLFQAVRRRDAAFARVLAPLGLDLVKWRALSVVHRLESCTMNELAGFTTIDRTTLTRVTDQLATGGLVARQGFPGDRRRVCLVLTDAGDAMFARGLDALRDHNLQALEGVGDDDLQVLKAALARILHNVTGSAPQAQAILDFARPWTA
jgi:DNA-binding MarR family transcriptional regulator